MLDGNTRKKARLSSQLPLGVPDSNPAVGANLCPGLLMLNAAEEFCREREKVPAVSRSSYTSLASAARYCLSQINALYLFTPMPLSVLPTLVINFELYLLEYRLRGAMDSLNSCNEAGVNSEDYFYLFIEIMKYYNKFYESLYYNNETLCTGIEFYPLHVAAELFKVFKGFQENISNYEPTVEDGRETILKGEGLYMIFIFVNSLYNMFPEVLTELEYAYKLLDIIRKKYLIINEILSFFSRWVSSSVGNPDYYKALHGGDEFAIRLLKTVESASKFIYHLLSAGVSSDLYSIFEVSTVLSWVPPSYLPQNIRLLFMVQITSFIKSDNKLDVNSFLYSYQLLFLSFCCDFHDACGGIVTDEIIKCIIQVTIDFQKMFYDIRTLFHMDIMLSANNSLCKKILYDDGRFVKFLKEIVGSEATLDYFKAKFYALLVEHEGLLKKYREDISKPVERRVDISIPPAFWHVSGYQQECAAKNHFHAKTGAD